MVFVDFSCFSFVFRGMCCRRQGWLVNKREGSNPLKLGILDLVNIHSMLNKWWIWSFYSLISTWEFDFCMSLLVADKSCLEMKSTWADRYSKEQEKVVRWMNWVLEGWWLRNKEQLSSMSDPSTFFVWSKNPKNVPKQISATRFELVMQPNQNRTFRLREAGCFQNIYSTHPNDPIHQCNSWF